MSMYAACFAQATFANDILAPKAGYSGPIDYILDDGNAYKDDVQVGYRELQRRGVKIGRLGFAQDSLDCALQAADMISWTVRRTSTGKLPDGFEPLADILVEHHFEVPYPEEWMHGVADKLREQAGG
jgi:hypothetical protein